MKKTLLAFALFAGVSFGASAQCTPDTTHFTSTKFVYPDSLPCVQYGQAFSGVVSIEIPDSLDASNFTPLPANTAKAYIDSVQITSITGMPAGITSASSPALGTWLKPGQFACAIFSGTTSNTVTNGRYPLTITGTGCGHFTAPAFLGGGTYDSCLTNFNLSRVYPYHLSVCGSTVGVSEVLGGVNLSIYPNPNHGAFTVSISTDDRIAGDIMVMDALGRTIHTEAIDITGTKQISLDLGNVASGVYMLVVNTTNGKAVRQFSVK